MEASGHDGGIIGKLAHRRTEGLFHQMDQHLATNTYLAGEEFTLADLVSEFALIRMPVFGGRTLDDLPNVQRYTQRLMQRPAWQRAMAIAGPQAKRPMTLPSAQGRSTAT